MRQARSASHVVITKLTSSLKKSKGELKSPGSMNVDNELSGTVYDKRQIGLGPQAFRRGCQGDRWLMVLLDS